MSRDFIDIQIDGQWLINDLGLTRVSEGSRYKWNLIPSITDTTVQVPNKDGVLYFGSNYGSRTLDLKVAYDGLSETQFKNLSEIFNGKKVHIIRFYERPYVKYQAKVSGTPSLEFVCFSPSGTRVYKGEGSIQFTVYDAFGYCDEKYLTSYTSYTNRSEWSSASELLSEQGTYDGTGATIKLWNPGVDEADFKAIYVATGTTTEGTTTYSIPTITISLSDSSGSMTIGSISMTASTDAIRVNSKLRLIEGGTWNSSTSIFTPNGVVYNEYISAGDFFKIPQHTDTETALNFETGGGSCTKLEYNYKFF